MNFRTLIIKHKLDNRQTVSGDEILAADMSKEQMADMICMLSHRCKAQSEIIGRVKIK